MRCDTIGMKDWKQALVGFVLALIFLVTPLHFIIAAPADASGSSECDGQCQKLRRIEMSQSDENLFIVQSGDTMWDIVRRSVSSYVSELTPQVRHTVIANILVQFRDIRTDYLQKMGVTSGDLDLIYPGDRICFVYLYDKLDTTFQDITSVNFSQLNIKVCP